MPAPSSCDRLTLRVVLFKVSPLVGRIYLMKMAARRQLRPSTKHGWAIFDTCLGCMACMTACPSGVDYAKLVEATRAQIERRFTRPAPEKRFRRFLFSIFTRPARLRALLLPLRLYQKAGLEALALRMGTPKLLSATAAGHGGKVSHTYRVGRPKTEIPTRSKNKVGTCNELLFLVGRQRTLRPASRRPPQEA
jgi:glycolate oxidase iron-sulfur subunit